MKVLGFREQRRPVGRAHSQAVDEHLVIEHPLQLRLQVEDYLHRQEQAALKRLLVTVGVGEDGLLMNGL